MLDLDEPRPEAAGPCRTVSRERERDREGWNNLAASMLCCTPRIHSEEPRPAPPRLTHTKAEQGPSKADSTRDTHQYLSSTWGISQFVDHFVFPRQSSSSCTFFAAVKSGLGSRGKFRLLYFFLLKPLFFQRRCKEASNGEK